MDGFDLVTEGVLTLGKTLENIKNLNNSNFENILDSNDYDGCSLLTNFLTDVGTHINLYLGSAVNPAHQNPNFPLDFNIKKNIIDSLVNELKKAGKKIDVIHI